MSTYDEKSQKWQKAFEELLIEIVQDKNHDGVSYMLDTAPLVTAFLHTLDKSAEAHGIVPPNRELIAMGWRHL